MRAVGWGAESRWRARGRSLEGTGGWNPAGRPVGLLLQRVCSCSPTIGCAGDLGSLQQTHGVPRLSAPADPAAPLVPGAYQFSGGFHQLSPSTHVSLQPAVFRERLPHPSWQHPSAGKGPLWNRAQPRAAQRRRCSAFREAPATGDGGMAERLLPLGLGARKGRSWHTGPRLGHARLDGGFSQTLALHAPIQLPSLSLLRGPFSPRGPCRSWFAGLGWPSAHGGGAGASSGDPKAEARGSTGQPSGHSSTKLAATSATHRAKPERQGLALGAVARLGKEGKAAPQLLEEPQSPPALEPSVGAKGRHWSVAWAQPVPAPPKSPEHQWFKVMAQQASPSLTPTLNLILNLSQTKTSTNPWWRPPSAVNLTAEHFPMVTNFIQARWGHPAHFQQRRPEHLLSLSPDGHPDLIANPTLVLTQNWTQLYSYLCRKALPGRPSQPSTRRWS